EGWPNITHSDAFKTYLDKTVKKSMMHKEAYENLYQNTLFFDYSIDNEPVFSSFVPDWASIKVFEKNKQHEVYDYKEQANSEKFFDEITKYYDNTKSLQFDDEQFHQVPTIFWRNNPQGSIRKLHQDLVKDAKIGKAL